MTASLQINRDVFEDLYINKGLSTRQCAERLGLKNGSQVTYRLRKFGIQARPVGCTQGKKRNTAKGKNHHMFKGGKITTHCKVCGGVFKVFPSQKDAFKRCDECKTNHMTVDYIGKRFGKLVVVGRSLKDGDVRPMWDCICDCGGAKRVATADLKNGSVQSCGCLRIMVGEDNPNWKQKVVVKCAWCGRGKSVHESYHKLYKNQFCSNDCYGRWRSANIRGKNHPRHKPRVSVPCGWCGEKITKFQCQTKLYNSHFCSKECLGRWYSENRCGEKNANWRNGAKNDPYCTVFHQKYFRQEIFERDNYRCQNPHCNHKTDKLSIHHIDYDKTNCHPDNLITLCVSCNSVANGSRGWHTAFYNALLQRSGKQLAV